MTQCDGKIRVIIQETDAQAAAGVGGPVATDYVTFDVEAPEVVARMRSNWCYPGHRSIVGVEVLPDEEVAARSPHRKGQKRTRPQGRLAEIARIIEDVDARTASNTTTVWARHAMKDDELRAIYALAKDGSSATAHPDHRYELVVPAFNGDELPVVKVTVTYRNGEEDQWSGDELESLKPDTPQPDHTDLLRELRSAAATVLDGLNERIQEAPDYAVPVFDGITELTEALVKVQEALGDG